MAKEKTFEQFLIEALKNADIDYHVIVSSKESKRTFYLISKEKGEKKKVIGFEVEGNNVKQIL